MGESGKLTEHAPKLCASLVTCGVGMGRVALVRARKPQQVLEHLDLEANALGPEGAEALARGFGRGGQRAARAPFGSYACESEERARLQTASRTLLATAIAFVRDSLTTSR